MGRTIDFDQARRKRQRARRARQLLVLTVVFCFILLGTYLNNFLVSENATTWVADLFGAFGGGGYPVNRPGGILRDTKSLGNNLVLLGDTNLYIYNAKGKSLQSIPRIYSGTVISATPDRILYWQIGGKTLTVCSSTKQLASLELGDSILSADLGDKGETAVITLPKQYVSQISVYNSKLDTTPFFKWYSTSNIVSHVSLSPKGTTMVAGGPSSAGGNLESTLYFFDLSSDAAPKTVILRDELLVGIDYFAPDQVSALTDRAYHIYDSGGLSLYEYALPDLPLAGVETYNGNVLLYFENRENRVQSLLMLSNTAAEIGSAELPDRVLDFALDGKQAYLLFKNGIATYSHAMEQKFFFEANGIQHIGLAGSTLYYFTETEICTLPPGRKSA